MKTSTLKQRIYNKLTSEYFWFYGNDTLARLLFKKHLKATAGTVLNIGCGPTGFSLQRKGMRTISADFSFEACTIASAKSYSQQTQFVCCDAEALPFKKGCFDAVVALELFEHLEDDKSALKQIIACLKEGGILLFSVPAFQFLWGSHDRWNEHFRRYRKKDINRLTSQTCLFPLYRTYFKSGFVVPLYLFRKFKALFGFLKHSHDFVQIPSPLNTMLKHALTIEATIAQRFSLPLGVTLFSVLGKDGKSDQCDAEHE
ncbi:class I SAM-dependent methyltransferase [Chitinispirillales bacterium ANBcel5]|uniref:class I SAM-dependent methyltransferase n=1 Tax=Cellulosispirillum alkaliphilum TaxID=3039283 RepID=UPI002A568F11|nr:class I SAM-dependent methyltransferase [Chitinispirillales bacterium ANBcel5]